MANESLSELAHQLLSRETVGTLSTMSRQHEGFPFGSVMPYAVDSEGRPVFLISSMAMHTKNLNANPRASLLVAEAVPADQTLVSARATFLGEVEEVDDPALRDLYLARHPDAAQWVDFGDFAFYRLNVKAAYYVGGFGVMGWL
ncbi:MAG: pyridoxamine 5'-phosphate oxidase family protein [Bryobacteraceae bacterium]